MSEFTGKIITKPQTRQDLQELIKDLEAQGQAAAEAQKKLEDSVAASAIALQALQESLSKAAALIKMEQKVEAIDQMIVYKESDVIHPEKTEPDFNLPRTCGYVKENTENENDNEEDDFDEDKYVQSLNRTKRQVTGELFLDMRQTRCPLLLVADYR